MEIISVPRSSPLVSRTNTAYGLAFLAGAVQRQNKAGPLIHLIRADHGSTVPQGQRSGRRTLNSHTARNNNRMGRNQPASRPSPHNP
jgi:hypothetical protein